MISNYCIHSLRAAVLSLLLVGVINLGYGFMASGYNLQAGFYFFIITTIGWAIPFALVVLLGKVVHKFIKLKKSFGSQNVVHLTSYIAICGSMLVYQYIKTNTLTLWEDGISYFLASALIFSISYSTLENKFCVEEF
jgi:hypothetical protein